MSIVTVEVESIHGAADQHRMIFYRAQDHLGVWHPYGPVITTNPAFDADAYKPTVAAKIAERLAEAEANEALI